MSQATNKERLRTAHHEAGHFVAAVSCGATVHEISCVPRHIEGVGDVCGYGRITDYPAVDVKVITHLAGPLSELRFTARDSRLCDLLFDVNYFPNLEDGRVDCDSLLVPYDHQTSKEYGEAFALVADRDHAKEVFRELMQQTKTLLNRAHVIAATERLAKDLAEAGELPDGYAMELLKSLL